MSNNTPELSDVLLYDPGYLNPELPTGFWFCADPEDVLAVQINAGCLRASAGWEALSRHERFFLQDIQHLLRFTENARQNDFISCPMVCG